jgi:hypothetical protein
MKLQMNIRKRILGNSNSIRMLLNSNHFSRIPAVVVAVTVPLHPPPLLPRPQSPIPHPPIVPSVSKETIPGCNNPVNLYSKKSTVLISRLEYSTHKHLQ